MLSYQVLSNAALFLAGLLVKGLVILLVAAIAANRMRRASAAVRHAAWTAGIVSVLALPIVLELGPRVHIANLAERFSVSLPHLRDAARAPTRATSGERAISSSAAPSSRGVLDGVSLDAASTLLPRNIDVPPLFFVVWIVGALVLTGRDIGRYVRARRLIARSRMVEDANVLRLATDLRNSFRVHERVVLVESDEVLGPATFGIIRPVVLLPAGAAAWPLDSLYTVLAHELAHVARQDCLTDAIALAARNVHWFNPMVWIAVKRMRLERERACDDRVLEVGVRPEPYATLLIDVARAALREPIAHRLSRTAVLAMAAPPPLELESRLLAIFDSKLHRGSLRRGQRFTLVTLATTASVLIAALRLEAVPATNVTVVDDGIDSQISTSARAASVKSVARPESEAPIGITKAVQGRDTSPQSKAREP
ncbi:MAG: M56 family metallopeptidase, partial [Gemmatimonadaceae bacterium]